MLKKIRKAVSALLALSLFLTPLGQTGVAKDSAAKALAALSDAESSCVEATDAYAVSIDQDGSLVVTLTKDVDDSIKTDEDETEYVYIPLDETFNIEKNNTLYFDVEPSDDSTLYAFTFDYERVGDVETPVRKLYQVVGQYKSAVGEASGKFFSGARKGCFDIYADYLHGRDKTDGTMKAYGMHLYVAGKAGSSVKFKSLYFNPRKGIDFLAKYYNAGLNKIEKSGDYTTAIAADGSLTLTLNNDVANTVKTDNPENETAYVFIPMRTSFNIQKNQSLKYDVTPSEGTEWAITFDYERTDKTPPQRGWYQLGGRWYLKNGMEDKKDVQFLTGAKNESFNIYEDYLHNREQEDGTMNIYGIRLYAAGKAGATVTFKELNMISEQQGEDAKRTLDIVEIAKAKIDDTSPINFLKYAAEDIEIRGTSDYWQTDILEGSFLKMTLKKTVSDVETDEDETDAVYIPVNRKFNMRDNPSLYFSATPSNPNTKFAFTLYYGRVDQTTDQERPNIAHYQLSGQYYKSLGMGEGIKFMTGPLTDNFDILEDYLSNRIHKDGTLKVYGMSVYIVGAEGTSVTFDELRFGPKAAQPVVTPKADPVSGTTFVDILAVVLKTDTQGAKIYYTVDGTTPSAVNGTEYKSSIILEESTTIKAIAVKDGMIDSEVATFTYTKNDSNFAKAPTANPASGTAFDNTLSVELNSATENAKIYYTLDGQTPTESSTLYTGAIQLEDTTTIRAIAVAEGLEPSLPVTFIYIKQDSSAVRAPAANPESGTVFGESLNITLRSETEGAKIYYTIDGSTPTTSSTAYTGPITIKETTTIKAIAVKDEMPASAVSQFVYTKAEAAAKPEASPKSGYIFSSYVDVMLETETEGADIYYTTNGTSPTTESKKYTGPIRLYSTTTIKAIAVKEGMAQSAVMSATYQYSGGNSGGSYYGGGYSGSGGVTSTGTISGTTSTEKPSSHFTDMAGYEWASESVDTLYEYGIVQGVTATTFAPGKNISRADFLVLLMRTFKLEAATAEGFPDVAADAYFAEYVNKAKALGIVKGDETGRFRPYASITREDMMVMTARILEVAGFSTSAASETILTNYSDADQISGYAQEAVAKMISNNLIAGSNGAIAPKANTTRAETAVMLYRMVLKYGTSLLK